jgi:hypothetical protein
MPAAIAWSVTRPRLLPSLSRNTAPRWWAAAMDSAASWLARCSTRSAATSQTSGRGSITSSNAPDQAE